MFQNSFHTINKNSNNLCEIYSNRPLKIWSKIDTFKDQITFGFKFR